MRASIRDQGALTAVSPAALSAYALAEGWRKTDIFGDHSDVYTSEGLPEIILPRHRKASKFSRESPERQGTVAQITEFTDQYNTKPFVWVATA